MFFCSEQFYSFIFVEYKSPVFNIFDSITWNNSSFGLFLFLHWIFNFLLIFILILTSGYLVIHESWNSIVIFKSIDISFVTIPAFIRLTTGSLFDSENVQLYFHFLKFIRNEKWWEDVHQSGQRECNSREIISPIWTWLFDSNGGRIISRLERRSWVKTLTLFNAS